MLHSRDMCNVSAMKGCMWERETLPSMWAPAFLLIYHKWDFQWLAGKSPRYQIISKWHLLAHSSSLEAWPLKALSPSKGANGMSWWRMLGLWQLATSTLGQTWHHLLLFWSNHGKLKSQWKSSGHRHLANGRLEFWNRLVQAKSSSGTEVTQEEKR